MVICGNSITFLSIYVHKDLMKYPSSSNEKCIEYIYIFFFAILVFHTKIYFTDWCKAIVKACQNGSFALKNWREALSTTCGLVQRHKHCAGQNGPLTLFSTNQP
ncbi:hypothetical protein AQUCO_03800205v1 [Aquilegia coerulea]|uniref:Uncharacterized protein n=1 Tax=Aquilegia coerulea TaxID=218851 RepID=A0A2G5CT07_AQUCA|nr:hypothetical protein AQUCO_03800205v1 [Aquilegia coerulea]